MSKPQPKTLKEKFNALPAGTRTAVIGGGVVVGLFALGTIFTDAPKDRGAKGGKGTETSQVTVFNPGHDQKTTEGIAAELVVTKKRMEDQAQQLKLLTEASQREKEAGGDGQWGEVANLTAQIQALKEQVNTLAAGGGALGAAQGAPSLPVPTAAAPRNDQSILSKILPTPQELAGLPASQQQAAVGFNGSNNQPITTNGVAVQGQQAPVQQGQAEYNASASPLPAQANIQVIGDTKAKEAKAAAAAKKKETPTAMIPAGSNFEAVLMTGMDASTAIGANKSPTPALLRVKTDAILPNLHAFNVRECFVLVGGFGNMSSERVEMRTETMSCVSETGEVYEGKIEGYVVGEDGKAGARGRLVSKQGSMLAKSFMAGFVGGLGGAFQPQPVQALNLNGGNGQQQYQYPGAEQMVGNAVSGGFSKAANSLAQFYVQLASQMFPIVELDASRKMTIILLKGVELTMEKKR